MAMGMNRRAEWEEWHAPPPQPPPRTVTQPPPQKKFSHTAVGYDANGIPLVNNRSGLGLGLGLNLNAKQSLLEFHAKKNAELLRYDPSVARFVQGEGSSSQRASMVFNSTRVHTSAYKAHARELELGGMEPQFGGRLIQTHRIYSESTHQHRFPRHPDDSLPVSARPSVAGFAPAGTFSSTSSFSPPYPSPYQTTSKLTELGPTFNESDAHTSDELTHSAFGWRKWIL